MSVRCFSSSLVAALVFAAAMQGHAHAQTFKGYTCKSDCLGHRAGYAWAARKGITDPSQCSGNSRSFYEGCVAYAEGR